MASDIIKNKKDWSKWKDFFAREAAGQIPYSPSGWYIVDENPEWNKKRTEKPSINLVTPVAQTIEQAKADLKDEERTKKKGQGPAQNKEIYGLADLKDEERRTKKGPAKKKERYGLPGSQYWK